MEMVTCPACNGSSRDASSKLRFRMPGEADLCPHCKEFGPFGLVPEDHEVLIVLKTGRGRDEAPRVKRGCAFAQWLQGDGGEEGLRNAMRRADQRRAPTIGDDDD